VAEPALRIGGLSVTAGAGSGRDAFRGPGVIANVVAFHGVWLLSLYGAGRGLPWLGAVALALFLVWHLRMAPVSPRAELAVMAAAALTGLVADTFFARAGILSYAAPWPVSGVAPAWIIVMWMNFALTLNLALRWLQGHALLAAVLGFAGGPFAYLAGVRLDAATLTAPPPVAYSVIGVAWAVAVPLLVLAAGAADRRWPATTVAVR
jgi:hypothetical protein